MAKQDSRVDPRLMDVLDYVLNRAGPGEVDAVAAAVERRKKDLSSIGGMGAMEPEKFARNMAQAVQESIDGSMEGMRRSFREFAVDLIRKEAPELTEGQMLELLDAWIPDRPIRPGARDDPNEGLEPNPSLPPGAGVETRFGARPDAGSGRYAGLARKGLVNGVPVEAMREMVMQFVAYSTGRLTLSDEAALRDAVGDWSGAYWQKFPDPIRALIRDFLDGGIGEADFMRVLEGLLS